MPSDVGGTWEPSVSMGVQILMADEVPRIDEAPRRWRVGRAILPLIGTVRPGKHEPETSSARQSGETPGSPCADRSDPEDHGHDAGHLIEQDLPRHAAEAGERLFKAREDSLYGLLRIDPQPEQPRVPENHQERVTLPPREGELGEIALYLVTGVGFEAYQ